MKVTYTYIRRAPHTKGPRKTKSISTFRRHVKQVQVKFQALAKLVSSGAHQIIGGVNNITSIGEASARVYMDGNGEEPPSYRRIASMPWSVKGTASSPPISSIRGPGPGPGPARGRSPVAREGEPSEAKLEEIHRLDEEVRCSALTAKENVILNNTDNIWYIG